MLCYDIAKNKWTLCAKMHACIPSCFTHVVLFMTPRAHQAPLFMGFSRQEYWSRLPCLPPGDLPDSRIELASLMSSALAGVFFTTTTIWETHFQRCLMSNCWVIHKHMKDLIFNYYSNQNYSDADNSFWI